MALCRICLNKKPEKDILHLQVGKKNDVKSYADIMMFCLDIKVDQNLKLSTKLCLKCYKKVLTFYKFKSLALKNDAYLKSLDVENEIFLREDEIKVKSEELSLSSDEVQTVEVEVKEELNELCLKTEDLENGYISASEDEYLSVIKKIKYEYVEEVPQEDGKCVQPKENAPTVIRKKSTKTNSSASKKQMCEECGKTVNDLKAHSYLHMPAAQRKRIKCHVCDKLFSSHSARYKHNKIKHLGLKQLCTICNKSVTHLKQHKLVMHNKEALPYECLECGRRFISKSNLDLHMRSHTKDRPFDCPQCDKKFSNKGLMHQHVRSVHEKEKTHLCQLCSKSFFKKYHLQVHILSHSKEKSHECPECGKFYKTESTLKSHRETHGDVRNFVCDLCTATFMKKEYLLVHIATHTKSKRYPCQYCGVKFHRSDHRKRHEYTAHQKHLIASATSS